MFLIRFVVADGFVVVECEEPVTGRATGQILLDYLTDAVVSQKGGLLGRPLVSPNSRSVVTLDRQRDGVTLVVQQVTGKLSISSIPDRLWEIEQFLCCINRKQNDSSRHLCRKLHTVNLTKYHNSTAAGLAVQSTHAKYSDIKSKGFILLLCLQRKQWAYRGKIID